MNCIFKCFEDGCSGTMVKGNTHYKCELSNGHTIEIEDLCVEQCNVCGEQLFDMAACKRIETEIENKFPNYFKK